MSSIEMDAFQDQSGYIPAFLYQPSKQINFGTTLSQRQKVGSIEVVSSLEMKVSPTSNYNQRCGNVKMRRCSSVVAT